MTKREMQKALKTLIDAQDWSAPIAGNPLRGKYAHMRGSPYHGGRTYSITIGDLHRAVSVAIPILQERLLYGTHRPRDYSDYSIRVGSDGVVDGEGEPLKGRKKRK